VPVLLLYARLPLVRLPECIYELVPITLGHHDPDSGLRLTGGHLIVIDQHHVPVIVIQAFDLPADDDIAVPIDGCHIEAVPVFEFKVREGLLRGQLLLFDERLDDIPLKCQNAAIKSLRSNNAYQETPPGSQHESPLTRDTGKSGPQ